MTVKLTKDSIDLGVVVHDIEAALGFYRDTLGFEEVSVDDIPGGVHMHRLMCGTSMIKVIYLDEGPEQPVVKGGTSTAAGNRYWTMSVSNLEEITEKCIASGCVVVLPLTEIRPGLRVTIVEDPEGNWVEFMSE